MEKQMMNDRMMILSKTLIDDIHSVRNGCLDYKKAMQINRLSCSAIRALATVVVANNHQDIQMSKIIMRQKELNYKMSPQR